MNVVAKEEREYLVLLDARVRLAIEVALDHLVLEEPLDQKGIREEEEHWGSLDRMEVLEREARLEQPAQLENRERLDQGVDPER